MSGEADVERMEETIFRARYKMKMVKPIETVMMIVWLIYLKEGRKERDMKAMISSMLAAV